MKVIFLDIDGVLNSAQFIKMRYHNTGKGGLVRDFCPIASSNFRYLLDEVPEAKIVISSSWRISHSTEEMRHILADIVEDPNRIVSCTEKYSTKGHERGYEIQDWLDAHPEVVKFIIIDDSNDMVFPNLFSRLVRTTWKHGLLLEDAEIAIKLLDPRTNCMDCGLDISGASNRDARCWECIRKAIT